MPFQIIRNDITKVRADAIVNTANPDPVFAGGTDAAVYRAAGEEDLLAERKKIGFIHPGEAAVTSAFALQAKYIIHTVGPVWKGGNQGEYETLASCYRKSLLTALHLGCQSIAFPLISAGVYGFPRDKALEIALREISDFLEDSEMEVTLVVFDRESFRLSSGLVANVGQYIDENYVFMMQDEEYAIDNSSPERKDRARRRGSLPGAASKRRKLLKEQAADPLLMEHFAEYDSNVYPAPSHGSMAGHSLDAAAGPPRPQRSLQDVMSQVGESFQQCLLRMIDERGLTDAQVYKRANIDRKLFSKIRCNPDYTPRRKTIISLAVALELNIDEMTDLLLKAGIALSPGNKFDLIIRYCVENRIYDSMTINAILFDYDQPLLGA